MGCGGSKQSNTQQPDKITNLLVPVKLGGIQCANRVFMAPMTRCRCDPANAVPNELLVKYYSQRASFGLIFTEASHISEQGNAFPGAGGIYSDEQTQGWKKVVDEVHAKGGKIAIQLFHAGRATLPDLNGGHEVLAPSAVPIKSEHAHLKKPYPEPKEMTLEDIQTVKQQYRKAAENAKKAGFDGVQLSAGNGYLVHQFLQDYTNKRTDDYGGSVEKRCRFALELIDELIAVFGKDFVGIRISPAGRYNEMYDSDPKATYKYLLEKLSEKQIAFVEVREAESSETAFDNLPLGKTQMPDCLKELKPFFKGNFISNEGYAPDTGLDKVKTGNCVAITFGKWAISNPTLPEKIKTNQAINTNIDWTKAFGGGDAGYTDYQ